MPLRYVRRRLTAENVLTVAVATAAVTRELADMLQFPPARAATSILLLIFQTIQDIQTNRSECYRLARRSLALLTDLRDAMEGRWQDAPESLLKSISKFERTLEAIYDYLKKEAEHKWRSRLMRKTTIETALVEYNLMIDDAARSFQIATLINIHYALEQGSEPSFGPRKAVEHTKELLLSGVPEKSVVEPDDLDIVCDSPVESLSFSDAELVSPEGSSRSASDQFSILTVSPPTIESAIPAAALLDSGSRNIDSEFESLEDRGFRRYNQSEVTLKGRSRISSGWWSGAREAKVEGREVLMLHYEGPYPAAAKRWLRDVKTLQNVYHPNLPQMVGYSGTDVPTPFILLANVQTRLPQAMVLDALKNASLLDCTRLLIRFYKDIFDAALYMQRQLSLTDSKIQDYVEHASFRIDGVDTMVMGLPPPQIYSMQSWRNFGLAHSVREIFISLLPNRGIAKQPFDGDATTEPHIQRKINHLGLLVRSILPSDDKVAVASERLREILGDDEDEEAESLSLSNIRMAAIRARMHGISWNNNFVKAHMFKVGDIGYVPAGADIKSFVLVKNVLEEGACDLEMNTAASGWKTHFSAAGFDRQQLQPFELPESVFGWALLIDAGTRQNVQVIQELGFRYVSDAWKVLLGCARTLASVHGVKPEELILVTRAGIDQRFMINDTRNVPIHHNPHFAHQHFQHRHDFGAPPGPQFGGHRPLFAQPMPGFGPPPPTVFYLFTSPDKEHESYISDTPAYLPPVLQAQRPPMRAKCIWAHEGTFGFMNYVQLHEEDFR